MNGKKNLSILYVVIAALLWGSNGIFVNYLVDSGLDSFERTSLRLIIAFLLETMYFIFRKEKQVPKGKDLFMFMLAGVLGVFGFATTYTLCINRVGMSVAGVLIYLMPIFVLIYSCLFKKEKISVLNIAAMIVNLLGCGLVSGIMTGSIADPSGIIIGVICAGFYAVNNIVISEMKAYDVFSRMYYQILFAALASIIYLCLFSDPLKIITAISLKPDILLISFLWAVCCTICTFYLFNKALKYINVTQASIISSFELVFAFIFGVVLFHEPYDMNMIIGALLATASIIVLNLK
ncbi:MAG: DMT family transporter [Erysipelotrichaceae bacterium]|nr:DMT family transporter [Erysipelotrichaceae bacterium]